MSLLGNTTKSLSPDYYERMKSKNTVVRFGLKLRCVSKKESFFSFFTAVLSCSILIQIPSKKLKVVLFHEQESILNTKQFEP